MSNSNEYMREYNQKHRRERAAACKRYYHKNKHKKRAKDAVARALLSGELVRPKTCQLCANGSVQAHHEDYGKPLDVVWLCPRHHGAYHKLQRFMLKEEIDREALRLFI